MECVEKWEELLEDELDYGDENLEEWFSEEWTEEGFTYIISEVIAFAELHEIHENVMGL